MKITNQKIAINKPKMHVKIDDSKKYLPWIFSAAALRVVVPTTLAFGVELLLLLVEVLVVELVVVAFVLFGVLPTKLVLLSNTSAVPLTSRLILTPEIVTTPPGVNVVPGLRT